MIRRAVFNDTDKILDILSQVLEVHAGLRPDVFKSGTTKYTRKELTDIITDDKRPVYVYCDNDNILGYAFCILIDNASSNSSYEKKELYIDDICVDENHRHKGIANALFDYVKAVAEENSCDVITLNVWTGNTPAESFYTKMGMKKRKTMMELKLDK